MYWGFWTRSLKVIEQMTDRRSEDFLALAEGLGYCWSVAVVALPTEGKALWRSG